MKTVFIFIIAAMLLISAGGCSSVRTRGVPEDGAVGPVKEHEVKKHLTEEEKNALKKADLWVPE